MLKSILKDLKEAF